MWFSFTLAGDLESNLLLGKTNSTHKSKYYCYKTFNSQAMKKALILVTGLLSTCCMLAQQYPDPEFVNEISVYNKDINKIIRMEKGTSKMDSKVKLGGMGGSEMGYTIDDERSSVRLQKSGSYSFVYWSGASSAGLTRQDSAAKANGYSPSMYAGIPGMDPSNSISLYKMETAKGSRKVILGGSGSMLSPFSKKNKESVKYPCSFKKVREGYYEIIVDKPLAVGEYGFVMMAMGSLSGSVNIYAFGID